MTEKDILDNLKDYAESWAETIKRLDCGETDNGIMTQIRLEQHDTFVKAADLIEDLYKERNYYQILYQQELRKRLG